MKDQFVPFELAVKLKELGFDEPCLGVWNIPNGKWEVTLVYGGNLHEGYINDIQSFKVCAPLWQQAFDWFARKGLYSYIEGAYPWFRYYINTDNDRLEGFKHLKIEKARQSCLEKLIEIVEDGK